jgi:outer membrane protein OmpA-like peptidoglycan-associated protein
MRRQFALILLLAVTSCGIFMRQPGPDVFYVFFPERSAALDASSRGVIAKAAEAAKAAPAAKVAVYGYTDRAGNPQADETLSQRRADRVADALAKAGVSPLRIVPEGEGQAASNAGVENQRVEITIER